MMNYCLTCVRKRSIVIGLNNQQFYLVREHGWFELSMTVMLNTLSKAESTLLEETKPHTNVNTLNYVVV